MPTTPSGRYIFRHAALQNHAVAENLAKIAGRSKATRQDIAPVHVMEDLVASSPVASSPVASSPVSRYRVMYQDVAYSQYRRSLALPIIGGLILIAGLLAIGFVIGPKIYFIVHYC